MLINEEIRRQGGAPRRARTGEQLGVVPLATAQNMAIEKNLDLVKIAPQATPPVCKIMDYGKYRFEQAKARKGSKKESEGHRRSRRSASP